MYSVIDPIRNIVINYSDDFSKSLKYKYDFHYSNDGNIWYYFGSSNNIKVFNKKILEIEKQRNPRWRIVLSGTGTVIKHYTGPIYIN